MKEYQKGACGYKKGMARRGGEETKNKVVS